MTRYFLRRWMKSEERLFDEKTRRGFWIFELDREWKVKCVCEQYGQRNPASIEFHRKSFGGERLISGLLRLWDEKKLCSLNKKFICLLEDSCLFVKMDLQYSRNAAERPPKNWIMYGEINISSRTEPSLDLTELVHLTRTDYSLLKQLSNDMEKLLEKSLFADVRLKCGTVSIPVHKSVLSVRFPAFETLFSCPMTKTMDDEVVIEDIEAPVLQAALECIYTGKIECLTPSLATNLLFIANKYQIACLESACSKYLMHNVSMGNVVSILCTGDLVSPDLKIFAIDFVCSKCTDYSALEKGKDWIDLKNNDPVLALEVFSAIVNSQEERLKMP